MSNRLYLEGKVFDRLTVIKRVEDSISKSGKTRKSVWLCRCSCGNKTKVMTSNLTTRHTTSCGCFHSEQTAKINYKHGLSNTPEYGAWINMIKRCNDPKHKHYKNYGGRGIKVCKRWNKFENFIKDMKTRPDGLELDRINNDKNYSKKNCRWTTDIKNTNNRRNTIKLIYNNKEKPLTTWARKFNIDRKTLYSRIFKYKWSVEKALNTGVQL